MHGTVAPMWLSDIGVSPIVAGNGERCWCGCQHVSSGRWLIWIWSRAQEAHHIRRFASITSEQFKYCSKTYIFSLGVLTLQAHIRHDPPQMASVAEDQPMYKPSPISYLRRSYMWVHNKRQRHMVPSDLCRLTLSQDKTGQRTAAWCWLHTKTRLSWCRCLQHMSALIQMASPVAQVLFHFPWNDKNMLFFNFKFDSVTFRRLHIVCTFVCMDILLQQLILCTQTGVQHMIHLSTV